MGLLFGHCEQSFPFLANFLIALTIKNHSLYRTMRKYKQTNPDVNKFITILNTAWLYPKADIAAGLAATTYSYTYTGNLIICPSLTDLIGVYTDIYIQTTISQPTPNQGFSLGKGTLLDDMGEELRFVLSSGEIVIVWRLVKQLTPQKPLYVITDPGNSPNGTIGYVTTFCSYGSGPGGGYDVGLDNVMVVRLG